jgi:disulfide bond formation protein DsbB
MYLVSPVSRKIFPVMIRDEQIARLMGAGAFALLIGALGFQYLAHLPPCEMCHWQRWPYFAAVIIGFGATVWKWNNRLLVIAAIVLVAVMVILLIAISGLIGAYQTGMQWGFLPGPSACTAARAYVLGSGAPEPEISCNVVTWSLFGLSLAAYNAICAFLLAGFGAVLLRRNHAA